VDSNPQLQVIAGHGIMLGAGCIFLLVSIFYLENKNQQFLIVDPVQRVLILVS
jgi:hypothetical protein